MYTVQSLNNTLLGVHRTGPCYKYIVNCVEGLNLLRDISTKELQENDMVQNSFVKFHGKKIGSHNMTILYTNLCYNKVCY